MERHCDFSSFVPDFWDFSTFVIVLWDCSSLVIHYWDFGIYIGIVQWSHKQFGIDENGIGILVWLLFIPGILVLLFIHFGTLVAFRQNVGTLEK